MKIFLPQQTTETKTPTSMAAIYELQKEKKEAKKETEL